MILKFDALLTTHKILNKRRIKGLVCRPRSSVIFIGPGLLDFLGGVPYGFFLTLSILCTASTVFVDQAAIVSSGDIQMMALYN